MYYLFVYHVQSGVHASLYYYLDGILIGQDTFGRTGTEKQYGHNDG